MSGTSDTPLFLIDANACNARQKIAELNELERLAQHGIIELMYTEITWNEARTGSFIRKNKVENHFFIGLEGVSMFEDQWRVMISEIVFPQGGMTENQSRDIDALLTAKLSGGFFVTNDGASKSQPNGILGSKAKLAALGVRVLNFKEAVGLAKASQKRNVSHSAPNTELIHSKDKHQDTN